MKESSIMIDKVHSNPSGNYWFSRIPYPHFHFSNKMKNKVIFFFFYLQSKQNLTSKKKKIFSNILHWIVYNVILGIAPRKRKMTPNHQLIITPHGPQALKGSILPTAACQLYSLLKRKPRFYRKEGDGEKEKIYQKSPSKI